MTTRQATTVTVLVVLAFSIYGAPRAAAQVKSPPVDDCDRLAAAPSDPGKVAEGAEIAYIDSARAIAACKAALAAYPNAPRFHYQLGRALHKAKSHRDAMTEYRTAAEHGYLLAMINIGMLYANGLGVAKDGTKALEWFRKADDNGDALAATYIGLAYINGWGVTKDYDAAILNCNEAIRRNPKFPLAYVFRGIAYASKNSYDRAITDYDEAIWLNPKLAIAYRNRGLANAHKNSYDRAITDFDEAIRLETAYAPGYRYRAIAYEHTGHKTEAIADYRKALLLDSADKFSTAGLKRLGAKPF
jgi:tetratricopeptide (TPR) repeat protein